MTRKLELLIEEDEVFLKQLLRAEKHKMTYEKLQALYFFKKDPSLNLPTLCDLLNKSQSQVKRWFKSYREGGLDKLLFIPPKPGRPSPFSEEMKEALKSELNQEKFTSYDEIKQWLLTEYSADIPYSTVHGVCRYKLGAKLKVARPSSIHKDEAAAIGFKKNCP